MASGSPSRRRQISARPPRDRPRPGSRAAPRRPGRRAAAARRARAAARRGAPTRPVRPGVRGWWRGRPGCGQRASRCSASSAGGADRRARSCRGAAACGAARSVRRAGPGGRRRAGPAALQLLGAGRVQHRLAGADGGEHGGGHPGRVVHGREFGQPHPVRPALGAAPRRPPARAGSCRPPPGPSRVTSRAAARSPRMAARSASRPTKEVSRARRLPCTGPARGRRRRGLGRRVQQLGVHGAQFGPGVGAELRRRAWCARSRRRPAPRAGRPAARSARMRRACSGSSSGWVVAQRGEFGAASRRRGRAPGRRRGAAGGRPACGPRARAARAPRSGRSASAGPAHSAERVVEQRPPPWPGRPRPGRGRRRPSAARSGAGRCRRARRRARIRRSRRRRPPRGRATRRSRPTSACSAPGASAGGSPPHTSSDEDATGDGPAGPQREHRQQGAQPRTAERRRGCRRGGGPGWCRESGSARHPFSSTRRASLPGGPGAAARNSARSRAG